MTIVDTMATTKDERIYIRVTGNIKKDFEALAEYRGLKPATLLHSMIVKTLHEARVENPLIFPKVESEKSLSQSEKTSEPLQKISVKSKKVKSQKPLKTHTTRDGKKMPMVDEAPPFKDDEQ